MGLDNSVLIIGLAIATLVIVLLYAVFQRIRVSKAKATGEHSALMDNPNATTKQKRVVER